MSGKSIRAAVAVAVVGMVLSVVAPAALAQDGPDEPASGAIVGGTQVSSADTYPFMAGLVFNGAINNFEGQFCGGSVIAQRWVLTAAHCPDGLTADDFQVLVDTKSLLSGGRLIPVKRIVMHPDYNPSTDANDVALLELTKDAKVPTAALPFDNRFNQVGRILTVIGWGALESGGGFPVNLREVDVPVVGDTQCDSSYGGIVGSVMLCAGDFQDGGIDSCQGDSGGPLFGTMQGRAVLAGVVSFGVGCALPRFPGVYSQVTAFVAWIGDVAGVVPPPRCQGKLATVVGTAGPDTLTGTNGPDVIVAMGGNDVVRGMSGNDTICGGPGNDELRGGNGRDLIVGGNGADRMWGDNAIDTLLGGAGPDTLNGGGGDDTVDGEDGNDRVRGNGGFDVLTGGAGEDELVGGAGDDTMRAGDGRDTADGGPGRDAIWGDPGNDSLRGGDDADEIRGGSGNDDLFGEAGPDNLIGGNGSNDLANGGGGNDTCDAETEVSC